MRNFPQTIASQFSASPHLVALIEAIDAFISPDADVERFFNLVMNVDTAQGYGLDVWGRIVGVGRLVPVPEGYYLGWEEAGDQESWDNGTWWNGSNLVGYESLTDEVYRRLILAKAATNITTCSIPAINAILMTLFPSRGNAYVEEVASSIEYYFGWDEAGDAEGWDQGVFGDQAGPRPSVMNMVYVFDFNLYPYEVSIVTLSGALPKPAGVTATVRYPGLLS